jgi:GT2 family glycosyltransferase
MIDRITIYAVILNWNRADLTAECVRSIVKYCPKIHIIIADNGSDDDSVLFLKNEFPTAIMIENGANRGFGAGNNPSIDYALEHGADYVWLLNNDVTIEPDALKYMLEKFTEAPDAGVVGSAIYDKDAPNRLLAMGGGYIIPGRSYAVHCSAPADLHTITYITGSSMLLKSETLRKVGLFDEKYFMYCEDADLCYRIHDAGYSLQVATQSRILHENGASSSDSALKSFYLFRSCLYFHHKHYSLLLVISCLLCFIADVILRDLLKLRWGHAFKVIKLILTKPHL